MNALGRGCCLTGYPIALLIALSSAQVFQPILCRALQFPSASGECVCVSGQEVKEGPPNGGVCVCVSGQELKEDPPNGGVCVCVCKWTGGERAPT